MTDKSIKPGVSRRAVLRLLVTGAGAVLVQACAPAATPTATSAPAKPTTAAPTAAAAPSAAATKPAATAAATKPAASPAASPAAAAGTLQPDPRLVAAAKSEGKGMLYAVTDPNFTQAMLAEFKNRYGIEVEFQRLTSGPLAQRFSAEADANNVVADVLIITDPVFMEQANAKGWLAKIDALPEVKAWPSDQRTDYSVSVAINPSGVAWNTSLVKDGVKTWQDLLDPKWKGQILLLDPRASTPTIEVMYLLRQTQGDDYLRKLGAQQPQLAPSAVTAAQQVAAGGAAILVPCVFAAVAPLQAQQAPIQMGWPEPTTPAASLAGISAKAPHPNVAKLLLDFYLSRDGQAILNKDGWSPIPGIPGTRPLPKVIQPKTADAIAARDDIVKLLGL